jgi:hypothetical protein
MAYYAENFNSWNHSQPKWRQVLKIADPRVRCLPFHGLGHALTDLIYGLREFWPVRRSVGVSSWGSPLLREAFLGMAREGYKFTTLFPADSQEILDWKAVSTNDLLTVVVVRDHPLTGQVLCRQEDLQKLNDKRIPFIELQFGWAWSRAELPLPFGAQIRVIDASKAVVVFGNRFRFHNHSASLMDWSQTHWDSPIAECFWAHQEDQSFVESFECELLQKQTKITRLEKTPRLFDRSLFVMSGVNGEFYLQQLFKHIKDDPLAPAGYEARCETANLARWQGLYPWSWWGDSLLTEAEQRSSVILSASYLKEKLSVEILNQVYLNCQEQVYKGHEESSLESKDQKKTSS